MKMALAYHYAPVPSPCTFKRRRHSTAAADPFTLLVVKPFSEVFGHQCDVYENLEREAKCGTGGYLLRNGLKYCRIFIVPEVVSRFSTAGKQFLNCARPCLIEHIQELFKNSRPTCDTIYYSAVRSHADCFLKCGFCEICKTEKLALLSRYDLLDFLSFEWIKSIYNVLKQCGPVSCLNLF